MSREPFERVVVDHGPMVARVARALVGAVDADDVWSETFLAALRAYPTLPPDANLAAWLTTIAQRKAIDLLRKRSRAPEPVTGLDDDLRLPDDDFPLPDDDLHAALATLTTRQRAAVVYHHVAGLPYAEIAVVIGGSEAAVRRSAADGIAKLRASYGKDDRS